MHDTSLEISIQGLHPLIENIDSRMDSYFPDHSMPKKRRLGPKIVNCATTKETRKLKETMVGVQVE